ncbi:MAG: PDZ domain-containing protein, partial [Acidobacteria bacterium]|nr:PDZ domain-containing protein [Acidobacteriota bacterium]
LVGVLLPDSGERGLRIEALEARGAAVRAGLTAGDVLLRVDGRPVGSADSLLRALGPGRPVRIEILRGGSRRTLLLAVGG